MSSNSMGGGGGGKGGSQRGGGGGGGGPNEKSYILAPPPPPPPSSAHHQGNEGPGKGGTTSTNRKKTTGGTTTTTTTTSQNKSTAATTTAGAAAPTVPESTLSSPSSVNTNDDMSQLVHQMDMDEDHHKSTLPQASFNYINSIIGSGVIGMPYALHQAGVGVGILLLILVAFITDYSLVLMVKAGQLSGSYSYQGMMEAAFGKWGFYVLSLLQFVYPIIAMISYNIIVGDTLTKVLIYFTVRSDTLEIQREAVVLAATFFVTLPLSLYRNVARMAKISFLSLVSIAFIMISILIRLVVSPVVVPATWDAWKFSNTGILQAIGVFAFAFMCHHNTFMIYTSMEGTNERKWTKVTHISIGIALAVSIVFSLGGYATFTGNVQGDLLENYCWDDDLINISRVLFCFTILLTFPLECFVARDVIENICFYGKQPSSTTRHFCITFLIVITAFVVSMSTDCLGLVLELNGILAAMPLAYILPALCFIRLEPSRFFSREKLPAIATALFGILVSGTGLIILIVYGHSGSHCSHGQPMPYCTLPPNFVAAGSSSPGGGGSSILLNNGTTNNLMTMIADKIPLRTIATLVSHNFSSAAGAAAPTSPDQMAPNLMQ